MIFDSVFSQYTTFAFEGDRPEISIDMITVPLNRLEQRIADRQIVLIEQAVDGLMRDATPLLQSGNVAGLNSLESSVNIALQQPIYEAWSEAYTLGSAHGIAEMVSAAPNLNIWFSPLGLRNDPAEQAVLQRSIHLAGNYSTDVINRLKRDLIASIQPQDGGNPISRRELRNRITQTLNVGQNRAEIIARTESTAAYNTGRLNTYNRVDAVTSVRFLAILDTRVTDICRSRNGLIWPKDSAELAMNTPPLHGRCRSVLSPIVPEFNEFHAEMVADPRRNPDNNTLIPLPKGWKT